MSVGTLTLTPSVVVGPATVAGAVTLECPAEPGDITVQLTSSQSTVAQPTVPSITIPRGASGGSFTVLALDVPAESSAVIGAEANRRKKTKKLIVQ
jgi:hypothetical protein